MCCSRRQNEVPMRDDPQEDHLNAIDRPNSDGSPAEEGLEEPNNLNQYIKELPDLEESNRQHTYPDFWGTVDGENVDNATIPSQMHPSSYELDPSISRDQHFTIIGFAPNRASEKSRIKVLIWGRFLISQHEAEQREWSCMFGEVEVPAVIIGNGVLSCHTPPHKSGRVPFYVTCSNRLACSELREFDFLVNDTPEVNNAAEQRDSNIQFGELRSSPEYVEDLRLQNAVKDMLLELLVQKITQDGERPNVLDEVGRDVLRSAVAFGYDWALRRAVVAGVDLNLRIVNGWAALHLAAYWGRASTVATLISLGAAPGELTDPNLEDPPGRRTPADLASLNGHQRIAGYLAYLSSFDLKS